jgi:NAD-dependent SIR2 family protein deacetylase
MPAFAGMTPMRYEHIVILTGAGLSAESGLGTFRDKGGLWEEFDLEAVATPGGFARDPARVHEFYNLRRSRSARRSRMRPMSRSQGSSASIGARCSP